MNKENTKYLKDHFPFLRTKKIKGCFVSLELFGFECGDGWFNIIRDLCEKLKQLKIPHYQVHQVKEKFGGLRFYGSMVPYSLYDKVWELINSAEGLSYQTCELCGQPGQRHSRRSWIITVCGNCASFYGYVMMMNKEWTLKK